MTEHGDVHDRLDRLESLVDQQQATIEQQQETIAEQRERIVELQATVETSDADDTVAPACDDRAPITTRRNALKAGGLLALLFGGVGTASADPQGQVGSSSDPLTALYTEELNGGVTGDTAVTDLRGRGLTIDGGSLTVPERDETQLTATDAQSDDQFGSAVGLSADGSTFVVGAPVEDSVASGAGKVYVFDASGTQTDTLTASDGQSNDFFGSAVGVNSDGSTVVVGAPEEDSGGTGAGKAYVFDAGGTQTDALTASDAATDNMFGDAVGVSADGSTIVVGAPTEIGTSEAGAAYLFDASGTQTATLSGSDTQNGDFFGRGVAVNDDGSTVVVGAPEEDSGGSNAGKAYVFDGSGTQTTTLTASDAQGGDIFGESVAVSGDGLRAVVGAPEEDSGGSNAGKAYAFDKGVKFAF